MKSGEKNDDDEIENDFDLLEKMHLMMMVLSGKSRVVCCRNFGDYHHPSYGMRRRSWSDLQVLQNNHQTREEEAPSRKFSFCESRRKSGMFVCDKRGDSLDEG